MIKNKFATYVIENCLKFMNKIDSDSFSDSYKDNDNNSNSNSQNDDSEKTSFEEFIQLKNKIYAILQNNSISKEKKNNKKFIILN